MKSFYCLVPVFLFLVSCTAAKYQEEVTSPNVVIIFTDDQGYRDGNIFGSANMETPNLNELAEEGIRLTNFYAAQPVCTASRAALLTGSYPNRLNVHGAFMPNLKTGLNPGEVTIAEMLKEQGYTTAHYGKWHLGDQPEFMPNNQGFDDFFGIPYSNDMWPEHPRQDHLHFDPLPLYENEKIIDTVDEARQKQLTTLLTEKAVAFIRKNKANPFFLYLAHPQPHVPLFVSEKFEGKSKAGLYGDVIMEIDWSVGEVLKALEENGLEENTLVIFTSDNGPWLVYGNHGGSAEPLREGKGTTWEGGIREPFIARFPGKFPANTIFETPVMAIDLFPTIAAVTGAKLPEKEIDGKNVFDVLAGKTTESPQEAYFFYYNKNELHSIRYKNWKMHFPHSYNSIEAGVPGMNGKPGKYEVVQLESAALFDLSTDPGERHNVIDKHPGVVKIINSLAEEKRKELGDALTGVEGTENRPLGKVE